MPLHFAGCSHPSTEQVTPFHFPIVLLATILWAVVKFSLCPCEFSFRRDCQKRMSLIRSDNLTEVVVILKMESRPLDFIAATRLAANNPFCVGWQSCRSAECRVCA